MFSPEYAGPPNVAARNPRRRQRNPSEDSVAFRPNPKRIRRTGLTEETFLPPDAVKANGHAGHVEAAALTNGHATQPAGRQETPADNTEVTLRPRGSKKGDRERRQHRNDGTELVSGEIWECMVKFRRAETMMADKDG